MTITITISNQTGEEISRILDKLAFTIRDWPGANTFRIGLHDLDGKPVGECVAESNRKRTTAPERSDCIRCGDPLEGRAVALCLECQEESSKEVKDACEREDEEL